MKNNIKIALVHDFLTQSGGAERVLAVLAEMFPAAPIYTILYDPEKMRGKFSGHEIRTSFFQKLPKCLRKRYKFLLPLLPTAPETFDLRDFDLVISSSGAWSKGIVTRLDTVHIAYIHSPMRFVWDYNEKYLREERKNKFGLFIRPLFSYFRLWDKLAADRPDHLIANSKYTQDRIGKYYRRESQVIYPPVSKIQETRHKEQTNFNHQISNFKSDTKYQIPDTKYFLIVSRLSAYKKIDKAIEAFNELKLPLVIAGEGKEKKRLQKLAGRQVKFLGFVPEEKLPEIYAGARAFVFPGVDDFGLAPAEAMAHGVPVLAIRKGGAREIVEEGKTGEFFTDAAPEKITEAVKRFIENEKNYDREYIINSTAKFSKGRFVKEFGELIDGVVNNFQ
jgi:glycosyltransferase involved in cell wall biosynthesis